MNLAVPLQCGIVYCLFLITYQVNMTQSEMLIAGYINNYEHVTVQQLYQLWKV
jgi:hypothetical protein